VSLAKSWRRSSACGSALTFRVIGITRYGRRVLAFEHDATRKHSPVINEMGKVIIIESKSIGETEPRMPVYDYPDYPLPITEELTNFEMVR
jgi:lysine 2,3-aminomutase